MTTIITKKINSVHLLRGVAITMIVFSHCLGVFKNGSLISNNYFFSFLNLFAFNFTTFFVLIAGFLFQHLTYKYDTKTYYLSKIKNVLCPYIVISIYCFLFIQYDKLSHLPLYSSTEPNIIMTICKMMLTGTQLLPLWFIPMVLIIYALAPLLYYWSKKNLIVIGLISMLWVIMFTKPDFTKPLLNLVHFGPVYLIGMMIKQNYEAIMKTVKNNVTIIIAFFCLCFFVPFIYRYVNYIGIQNLYLDTLQKIILFILALYFLDRLNEPTSNNTGKIYRLLSKLAYYSFPIYFIHEIIIFALEAKIKSSPFGYIITTDNGYIAAFSAMVILFVTISLSVFIAFLLKLIFKKKVRYLIGLG